MRRHLIYRIAVDAVRLSGEGSEESPPGRTGGIAARSVVRAPQASS
jgi:hypothetical protein